MRTKKINNVVTASTRDGVVAHGEGGVRLQSDVEKMLRIILSTMRRCCRKRQRAEVLAKDAQTYFEHVELLHKEFKQMHLLFGAQKVCRIVHVRILCCLGRKAEVLTRPPSSVPFQ